MRFRFKLQTVLLILLAGCGARPHVPDAAVTPKATPSGGVSGPPRAAGDDQGGPTVTDQAGDKITLGKLTFDRPEGWQRKPASSSFVLSEFTLPRAEEDDADGRLTVSVAGGSIEANIERWRDQFGGQPQVASEQHKEINGLEVTLVDFAGEFNDQRGPFAPATKRHAYRMLAAVIPVDGELHFIKATGPQATMTAHEARFAEFIGSAAKAP